MESEDLNASFERAVQRINEHTDPFPADVLLRLYAYYKRATNNSHSPGSYRPIINAFKTNALFQTRGLSSEDAKRYYVETVEEYFKGK